MEIHLGNSFFLFKSFLQITKLKQRNEIVQILFGYFWYILFRIYRETKARQSEIYGITESLNKRISTGALWNDQNNATRVFYINTSVTNVSTSLLCAMPKIL